MGDVSAGVDRLVRVVQELSLAHTLSDVVKIVRVVARELSGADGATFVLRDGDMCFYLDEDAIGPLWRGQRFPMSTCISGWAMLNQATAVVPDIYADDRIPHDAYRPTFVRSLVTVPIRQIDPLGAIGNYWSEPRTPTADEIALLEALANATSIALANIRIRDELAEKASLAHELRLLSATDDLTGLLNRRGFLEQAQLRIEAAITAGVPSHLAYVDMDGLKAINDQLGHAAGDAALSALAGALADAVPSDGVVGRLGGDEFAVVVVDPARDADSVHAFLSEQISARHAGGAAVGVTTIDPHEDFSMEAVLIRADASMYDAKRARAAH